MSDVPAFFRLFAAASEDAQALFAGHLAFVVARGADLRALRPEFHAPLARFAELAAIDDALSPADTAAALDAFFADHAVDDALVRAFDAFAAGVARDAQAAHGEAQASAAQALLGTSSSKVPVGAVKVEGAVPGGTLGLLHARTSQSKRKP